MNKTINQKTVLKRKNNDLLESPLADELVMMNMQTGDYIALNEVATYIWVALETDSTVQNICQKLLEKYDIDEATCEEQTIELVGELIDNNLIEIQNN